MQSRDITVKESRGLNSLPDFIRVPHRVYKDDPNWIAPLDLERREHFSPKSNPYFEHAQVRFFVAYDAANKPVGRISAQIDNLEETGATIGHFGCLEATNIEVMGKLLKAAEDWLRGKDIKEVTGPYSLSINDEVGLLVSGYHSPPKLMMNYAPAWYADALEELGYSKAKDLYAYEFDMATPLPENSERMAKTALKRSNVTERPIRMKNLKAELGIIMDIFNDAWSDNWGFTPMTQAEIKYMARNLRPVIDPHMARIISVDGEPAGMIVGLPDVNEAMAGLKGKLFPLGWLKLLYRLKFKGLKGCRVVLMGIRQKYQGSRLGGTLAMALIARLREIGQSRGYRHVEMSWILEENTPISKIIESLGGKHYKTYRIYKKQIEAENAKK